MTTLREVCSRVLLASSLVLCTYAATASAAEGRQEQSTETAKKDRVLEEVVVTGTHIRGVETASPLLVFDQADFDRAGAATAQEFLAKLPQNFGGAYSDDTHFGLPSLSPDTSFGNTVNLRGLGSGSTLILINGRRASIAGSAAFVDVSMIPLSAVDRVEVLTDGASAVYGSDAVGGVVNFIMRQDYEGAETRLRAGTTTQGGGDEYQLGQSLGTRWNSGSALLSYEYYRRDAVNRVDRDFADGATGLYDLVPMQEKHSVYASAQQSLGNHVRVAGDVQYTDRNAEFFIADNLLFDIDRSDSDNQQYGGSLGLTVDLGGSWQAELTSGLNRNKNGLVGRNTGLEREGLGSTLFDSEYRLSYSDLKLTGDLLTVPAGTVKLALGASRRDESYVFQQGFSLLTRPPRSKNEFDATAVFGELLLPVVGGGDDRPEAPRLALTVAGRYEEYSNFGSTFDPKFGLRWLLSDEFKIRATYGTSFRAPNLYQTNEFNSDYFLLNIADPQSPTGTTRYVAIIGNNASLHEETATTWTVGVDFSPAAWTGFKSEITYFDIDYRGRIEAPGFLPGLVLNSPAYAGLRVRRGSIPDAEFNAMVAELLSGREHRILLCAVPVDPVTRACAEPVTNVGAILDFRPQNLAGMQVRGIDLALQQRIDTSAGVFDLDFNASYLFDYKRQVTSLAQLTDFVDTVLNPTALRARAGVTWSRDGWSVTGSVNHANAYTNNAVTPTVGMSSWTTVDLNVRFDTGDRFGSGWIDDTALTLNVTNLFDKDPPFFGNNLGGVGYDPANADPLGRIVTLSLVKQW